MFDIDVFKARMAEAPGEGLEKRAAQFFMVKNELAQIEQKVETLIAPLLEIKRLLEGYFQKFLDETNQSNAVTLSGTINKTTRYTASIEDPTAFWDFVTEHGAFELIDRKANVTAVKEYITAHHRAPPGIKMNALTSIGVRQATAKQRAKREEQAVIAAVTTEPQS